MKVINLWGGPGSGKSTTAAGLFAHMKLNQMKVELVTEFAKDLTYENSFITLSNQLLVTGQQDHRLRRLEGQVDYIITDSPLPLGLMYASGVFKSDWFQNCVIGAYNSYDNINFFVRRVKPYAMVGRTQTETESDQISNALINMLERYNLPYIEVDGDCKAHKLIYRHLFKD